MVFKDYYKILDLDDITFDQEKIKSAYKKQAKIYHPDTNSNDTSEIFNDIYESYQVLSNPNKKRAYDRLWLSYIARDKKENKTYEHKRRNVTIEEEIRNLFLGEKLSQVLYNKKTQDAYEKGLKTKEKNIVIDLNLTIEEAFKGGKKEITFNNLNNQTKTIYIDIPVGIRAGDKLQVKNFEKAVDFIEQTNLIVNINIINDEDLELKGINLYKYVHLYPWDFAFGKKLELNILGENIVVFIPKHSSQNFTFNLKQKGFVNKQGFRGDLFIKTNMVLPSSFSEEELELYKKLEDSFNKSNN